jgi:hypothetical protein
MLLAVRPYNAVLKLDVPRPAEQTTLRARLSARQVEGLAKKNQQNAVKALERAQKRRERVEEKKLKKERKEENRKRKNRRKNETSENYTNDNGTEGGVGENTRK